MKKKHFKPTWSLLALAPLLFIGCQSAKLEEADKRPVRVMQASTPDRDRTRLIESGTVFRSGNNESATIQRMPAIQQASLATADTMEKNLPIAKPVAGKPTLVESPFVKNKRIDIKGLKTGMIAVDPFVHKPFVVP